MDFVLDEQFKPWLIEINMSPGCSARNDWIKEMLESMTSGALDIIEDLAFKLHSNFQMGPNEKRDYAMKWVKIFEDVEGGE